MKQNKRLGKQDVGKMFPVCVLLFNVRSVLYGNQTAGYYGLDGLMEMSLFDLLQ